MNFQEVLDKAATGSCILWRNSALISELIEKWTDYTHASLVVRLDNYSVFRGKVFLIEAYEHGLEFNALKFELENKDSERVDLFVPEGLTPFNQLTILKSAFLLLAHDKGYDFQGLFESAIHHPLRDPRRFFCSEFVDYVWIINNLKRKVENEYAAWPGDIPKWWEGTLYNIKGGE